MRIGGAGLLVSDHLQQWQEDVAAGTNLQSRMYDVAGYARKVTLDIVVDNRLNPTAHPGKPLLPRKKSSVVLLPLLKYAPRPGTQYVLISHTKTRHARIHPKVSNSFTYEGCQLELEQYKQIPSKTGCRC